MKRTHPRIGFVVMGIIIGFLLAVAVGLVVASRGADQTGVGAKIVVPSPLFDYDKCRADCDEAWISCSRPFRLDFLECMEAPLFDDGQGNCYGPDGKLISCSTDESDVVIERAKECQDNFEKGVAPCREANDTCRRDCEDRQRIVDISPSPKLK